LHETDRLISGITGEKPLFFRPPYGVVNPLVGRALKQMHWKAVCWDIRSFDTVTANPQKTIRRITRKLKPGSVILLHDTTAFTADYLDELVRLIQDAGYSIIPLDKMLNLPAYGNA
jgi:peptidoglycan/xylan/chitin deacetylase (PgdA/CDA1 family)